MSKRRNKTTAASLPSMPLVAPRDVHRPTLLTAAFEARRALVAVESQSTGTSMAAMADAAMRIMVQLHGMAECVGGMANTGLLHLDLTAQTLQTRSTLLPEGGWKSQTMVLQMPGVVSRDVTLDPSTCNAIMNALVVFSVAQADVDHELVEFYEMATMLATDWPTIDAKFESLMRAAWETRQDARSARREYPLGRLAHEASARLHAAAIATGVPAEEEQASVSATDFAVRTLRWIGRSVSSPSEPLSE